ncbi:MAG: DUF3021 domain-containing protein [Ruminococcaceae bacterium]|nr:DUF3021 domain-containing protein [Oscillospiraceae bacterium]
MKKTISDFCFRGLVGGGFGPLVLAVVYLILHRFAGVETLSVDQLCRGIFSLYALAFAAGGLNVLYAIERLPLAAAILIHGAVLYAGYLLTFRLNDWLQAGTKPLLIFSAVFLLGYLAVWVVIYAITRKNTAKVNELLKKQRAEKA